MSLEGVLLGLLREPASGYDVKQAFDRIFSHIWSAELSQIYRTLKALERDGCLSSARAESDKGPQRRVYRITAKGRRRLHAWLDGGPVVGDERYAYVAQLFFLGELGDLQRTQAFVEALRARFATRANALKSTESEWRAADPSYPDRLALDAFHTHLTLRMGIARMEALLVWADETLRRVKKRQPTEKVR